MAWSLSGGGNSGRSQCDVSANYCISVQLRVPNETESLLCRILNLFNWFFSPPSFDFKHSSFALNSGLSIRVNALVYYQLTRK